MAEYAANTPISRPVAFKDIKPDSQMNGFVWSNQYGFMFSPQDEFIPLRLPSQG